MAQSSSQLFNRRASERLRNPDDLDKYLRVTNPSVWVVLAACAALLVGLLVWGVFGTLAPNVQASGVSVDGRTFCLVAPDDVDELHKGDEALVDGVSMVVWRVDEVPVSRDEARELLGSDYLVSSLMAGDWAYVVELEGDPTQLAKGVPLEAVITVDRIAPITLLAGGGR